MLISTNAGVSHFMTMAFLEVTPARRRLGD
jgi:hypothetical protein